MRLFLGPVENLREQILVLISMPAYIILIGLEILLSNYRYQRSYTWKDCSPPRCRDIRICRNFNFFLIERKGRFGGDDLILREKLIWLSHGFMVMHKKLSKF
jgi:hypothetical protein